LFAVPPPRMNGGSWEIVERTYKIADLI
jgi:hypothetical protein